MGTEAWGVQQRQSGEGQISGSLTPVPWKMDISEQKAVGIPTGFGTELDSREVSLSRAPQNMGHTDAGEPFRLRLALTNNTFFFFHSFT